MCLLYQKKKQNQNNHQNPLYIYLWYNKNGLLVLLHKVDKP